MDEVETDQVAELRIKSSSDYRCLTVWSGRVLIVIRRHAPLSSSCHSWLSLASLHSRPIGAGQIEIRT